MDRKVILESAQKLQKISEKSYAEYNEKSEFLVNKMNSIMLERPDLEKLIGSNNSEMMKDNHSNHVRFLVSMFNNYNADVFVDTILWVFRAYRSHGFTTNYWATQLNAWINIMAEELTPACYQEVFPYYEWMQTNIASFVLLSDEKLEASNSKH